MQQPRTGLGSEPRSRQVWLQQALSVKGAGSTPWQLPGGQQSLTAGLVRLGHMVLGAGQAEQVPSAIQVVPGGQQVLPLPQMLSLGQQMVMVAPLNRVGRQDVLQQSLLVSGPLGPRLGQAWPLGQHTLSWLAVGAVKEGLRRKLQLSQQARLVGSEPGHTGHTVWLAWGQHPTLESRQASVGQQATVPFDKLHA